MPRRITTSRTERLAESCVYTILHLDKLTEALRRGGTGTQRMDQPWRSALSLFHEAAAKQQAMLVLFADARDVSALTHYARLTSIEIAPPTTTYSFEDLAPLSRGHRPQELSLVSTGRRIAGEFRRAYAVCRTPAFVRRSWARTLRSGSSTDGEQWVRDAIDKQLARWPDRREIAACFAEAIHTADALAPESWCLTVPRSGILRLNVGPIEVLTLAGDLWIGVTGRGDARGYPSLPGSSRVRVEPTRLATKWPLIRGRHRELVELATEARTKSTYAAHHSPVALEYVEEIAGIVLPARSSSPGHRKTRDGSVPLPFASEGELREVLHHSPRRSRALRDACIAAARRRPGGLRCQVPGCGFDFEARYGELGHGFAHVHHRDGLRGGRRDTGIDDLAIVCANCHAMIHLDDRCRTLAQVGEAIRQRRA